VVDAQKKLRIEIPATEAGALAEEAFVFGLPLVYIAMLIEVGTNVSRSLGRRAPINQFKHYREFPDPSNRSRPGLNVDTLYSFADLDLEHGPLVLSIPEMGERYWIMELVDAWNNVPHAPGSRTIGDKGGNFAIVGPNWTGTLPSDLTRLDMPTNLAILAGRTYTIGMEDFANVNTVQDRYRLEPLASWENNYVLSRKPSIKPGIDSKTP
jgi:hypothetical protein